VRRPEAENDGLEEAAAAFRRFFTEVRSRFPEREAVVERLELALLSREHVLLTGPPGSGKSALVAAVLQAIRDTTGAPSLFARQLTETTVQSDLVGPVDFRILTETGRTVHLLDEGMLGARFAFLDEVFDGRDMLLRSILNVLHERELKHGPITSRGLLECAVLTSNRSLSDVLERAPELMGAFADRIAFSAYVPRAFAEPRNRSRMLARALEGQRPALSAILPWEHLSRLQREVARVEVPAEVGQGLEALTDAFEEGLREVAARHDGYRPSRIFSQRGLVKAQDILRAAVVRDRIWRSPARPAEARLSDLEALRATYTLGGPSPEALEVLEATALDPREQTQLRDVRLEQEAFGRAHAVALQVARGGAAAEAQQLGLAALRTAREALPEELDPDLHIRQLTRLQQALVPGARHPGNLQSAVEEARAEFHLLTAQLSRNATAGRVPPDRVLGLVETSLALLAQEVPGLVVEPAWLRELGAQLVLAGELLLGALDDAALVAADQPLSSLDMVAGDVAHRLGWIEELSFRLRQLAEPFALDARALATLRASAGVRLRRCIEAAFANEVSGPKSLTSGIEALERLEPKWLAVSPELGSLRAGLLEPLIRSWTLRAVSMEGGWLSELTTRLRETLRLCQRHDISPQPTFDALRPLLAARLSETLGGPHARRVEARVPDIPETLTSGAYDVYRQHVAASGLEGEGEALMTLEALFLEGGSTGALVAPALRSLVRESSLQALEARVQFLQEWFDAIAARVPPPDEALRPADAARWLARLIDSRFPLLTLREGELRRLGHALQTLPAPAGAEARVRDALNQLETLTRGVESLGHRLLEQRRS